MKRLGIAVVLAALACSARAAAPAPAKEAPHYDASLAATLGGNDNGMRRYVFVTLRTGPTRVAEGKERTAMFEGHFANIARLSSEGKLAYAGPLDGVDGARGIYIFAVDSIDEAKKLVATDPVIVMGEMVAEYHEHYGSAGLMMVTRVHPTLIKPK